jgi:hypothetical protein
MMNSELMRLLKNENYRSRGVQPSSDAFGLPTCRAPFGRLGSVILTPSIDTVYL